MNEAVIKCPCCAKQMNVAVEHFGNNFKCIECENRFFIKLDGSTEISTPQATPPPKVQNPNLRPCFSCYKEISKDALTCPHCGRPNKEAQNKEKDSKQRVGCFLILLSIPICFLLPPLGGVMMILGIIMFFVFMRFK